MICSRFVEQAVSLPPLRSLPSVARRFCSTAVNEPTLLTVPLDPRSVEPPHHPVVFLQWLCGARCRECGRSYGGAGGHSRCSLLVPSLVECPVAVSEGLSEGHRAVLCMWTWLASTFANINFAYTAGAHTYVGLASCGTCLDC